jgi:geranylgeranyl diphosphate synthase type II
LSRSSTSTPRPTLVRPKRSAGETDALAIRRRAFERHFRDVIPPESELPERLHAAMRYGALAPGKRLRPLLVLTACEAVGGKWREALPAAAAVECVHAFSLMHDDLPAMDDDDYRRGRLTTHKKFGEALGILAGDALLALAFESLAQLKLNGVPAESIVEAMEWLANATGSLELVGGQVLDLEAEGQDVDQTTVEEIHARKTGALMSASLRIGGIVGGASEQLQNALGLAGRHLGVAFQVQDDLLNRDSSLERLGKRAGTDEARGKATYPKAVGEEAAIEAAEHGIQMAILCLESCGPKARNLMDLIAATAVRER